MTTFDAVEFIQDHECLIDTRGHQIQVLVPTRQGLTVVGKGVTLADAVDDARCILESIKPVDDRPRRRTQIIVHEDAEPAVQSALLDARTAINVAARRLAEFGDADSSGAVQEVSETIRDLYVAWGGQEGS